MITPTPGDKMNTQLLLKKYVLAAALGAAIVGFAMPSMAADTLKIAKIIELTGPGTTAGTNFRDGTDLAIKEINAAGGVLGRQIEASSSDTQTNPGIAKGLAQKAIDNEAFAVFGPV